jgi:TP901 family phage tail tape measure protein
MVKVEGKAVVSIDGQDAGKQLENLQTKASDLRKKILEVYNQQIVNNDKIKLAVTNLNDAKTKVSELKLQLAAAYNQEIIDKTKIAEIKNQLKESQNAVKGFQTELDTLSKSKSIDILNQELKSTESQITQVKTQTFSYQQVLKNLDGSSLKELQKAHKLLTKEVETLDRTTEEYALKSKQLQTVGTTISKVKTEMKGVNEHATKTPGLFSKITDGFNKFSGIAIGIIGSLTGMVLGFRQVVQTFNDFEEKVDNLQALTGLAGDELDWLSEQARTLATTTTDAGVKITQGAGAIVDAFTTVGSKRPELLAVKEDLAAVTEDAIILSQAAKTELDPAVTALTTTLNQFNLSADQSGRVINTLAAGSKVGAGEIPYISEAMEKAGTQANLMGVSIEEMVGAIETVAPYWTEAATAGNSLEKVLMTLKEKQIGYTDGVFNMNDALDQLETMYASGITSVDIFKKEHSKMGEILVANKEIFKTYTEQVTNTNTAIEQATINSNNNAAALAQAKNKVEENSIVLGEKLAPALTFSTNAFSYLMKAIIAIIENWDILKKYLITGAITLGVYTVAVNGAALAKKAYGIALGLAEKAQKLFNTAVKTNPWGLILTAITAVVTAIIVFQDEMKESNKAVRDFNSELAKEKLELNNVFEALKKTKPGTEERKELIEKINTTYADYIPKLLDETSNLYDIAIAQAAANKALEENIALKYQAIAQEEAISTALEVSIKASNELIDDLKNADLASVVANDWQKVVDKAIEADFEMKNSFSKFEPLSEFINTYKDNLKSLFPEAEYLTYLDKIVEAEKTKNEELLRVNAIFNSYIETDTENNYNQELMALRKQLMSKLIEEDDYWLKRQELEIKYGISSGIDYSKNADKELTDEEKAALEEAVKAAEDAAKAKADAETELAKYIKEMQKELLEAEKEKAIAEVELWYDTESEKIDAMEAAGAAAEEIEKARTLMSQRYVNQLSEIESEYETKRMESFATVADFLQEKEAFLATERQKIIDAEVKAIEAEYDEKIKLAQEAGNMTEQIAMLEKAKAEEVAAFKLEKELELADEILAAREEYGLVTDEEYYQTELDKLQEYYDNQLLTLDEFNQAKDDLEEKYRQQQLQAEAEVYQQKKDAIEAYASFFNTAKNLELKITEDNYNSDLAYLEERNKKGLINETEYENEKTRISEQYAKRQKEIEKQYALITMTIAISQAIANGAIAVTKAMALSGILGPIAAAAIGAETALQVIAARQEYNTVMGLETGGEFGVTRQQDGRRFNATYDANKRGYVSKPTVLVGENNKREYVVSYDLLQNPDIARTVDAMEIARRTGNFRQIDFSRILNSGAILKGYEEGGFIGSSTGTVESLSNSVTDYSALLINIIGEVKDLKSKVDAYCSKVDNWATVLSVSYNSWETANNEMTKLKTSTSIRRA